MAIGAEAIAGDAGGEGDGLTVAETVAAESVGSGCAAGGGGAGSFGGFKVEDGAGGSAGTDRD